MMPAPQTALKYEVEVTKEGRVELPVPFPAGAHLVIFIVEQEEDGSTDLLSAAQSSLGFWDNPIDDQEWNHA
jgi:hypothetical protein